MTNLHRAQTLLVSGPDAGTFLHGQFSSKISALASGQWQFSAWLDHRGRVRALFHLARLDAQRYLLLLRGGSASDIARDLARFVMRAKVTIDVPPLRALATGPALPLHDVDDAPQGLSFGCGTHALCVVDGAGDDDWREPQLQEGWAWLPAVAIGELLPATLSLQGLQAVAIDKGCYPGQEIVARLHFRGGHKRHLHLVAATGTLVAGCELHREGHAIGLVLDVLGDGDRTQALVVLDDAMASASASEAVVMDDGTRLQLLRHWPA